MSAPDRPVHGGHPEAVDYDAVAAERRDPPAPSTVEVVVAELLEAVPEVRDALLTAADALLDAARAVVDAADRMLHRPPGDDPAAGG